MTGPDDIHSELEKEIFGATVEESEDQYEDSDLESDDDVEDEDDVYNDFALADEEEDDSYDADDAEDDDEEDGADEADDSDEEEDDVYNDFALADEEVDEDPYGYDDEDDDTVDDDDDEEEGDVDNDGEAYVFNADGAFIEALSKASPSSPDPDDDSEDDAHDADYVYGNDVDDDVELSGVTLPAHHPVTPEDEDDDLIEILDEIDGDEEEDEYAEASPRGPAWDVPLDVAFNAELCNGDDSVLGSLMESSAAFRDYAAKRVAQSEPTLEKVFEEKEVRDWQVDFGPVWGPAGAVTTISIPQQVLFRCDKIIATDSFDSPGYGTRIMQVLVGQKVQRPAGGNGATLTAFFAASAFGNGVHWDTCQRALEIAVTVSFVQTCTFDMTCFGKAVV